MAGWWRRAAPWQKIWVGGSLIALALGVIWAPPRLEAARFADIALDRARIIADFEKPECQPVRSTPYPQLAPIGAGAPCYEIYVWRKNVTEKLPLILNHVLFPLDAHRREVWLAGAVQGGAWAALLAGLAYAALWAAFRRRA